MKTRKRKIEIGIVSDVANFRRKIIIGLATLLMGIFVLPARAQCEAKNDAFKSGEHVMYDLYFNWKFVWVKAGLASLTTNATTYHSEPAYRINLLALGSKRADFFFFKVTSIPDSISIPVVHQSGTIFTRIQKIKVCIPSVR